MTQFGTPPRLGSLTPDTIADTPEDRLGRMMREDAYNASERLARRDSNGWCTTTSQAQDSASQSWHASWRKAETWQMILDALRRHGPASAADVAKKVPRGVSTVRDALPQMEAAGRVTYHIGRSSNGRICKIYRPAEGQR